MRAASALVAMGTSFMYFGFGSNLLKQRLLLNNPSARFVDIAKLSDFRLAFDTPRDPEGSRWEGAVATIRSHPGGCVWGTVWELDMAHSDSLDRQEVTYFRREVSVTSQNGTVYACRTYEMKGEFNFSNQPSPQYKDIIVRGAKQSGLPQDYINQLEAIKDNGFKGRIPLYDSIIENLEHSESQQDSV